MCVPDESRFQNHKPIREQKTVIGHAVRQLYLCAGVTDLYIERGDQALLSVLDSQWRDLADGKLFITGGVGQRHECEVIADAYELPPDRCYCETCAAAASIFWNWRMLLATGHVRHADIIERTLYNALLAGYGRDGEHFFYANPLQSRGPNGISDGTHRGGWRRARWHGTACCPPNVMRLLASMDHYVCTNSEDGLQIHQYCSTQIRNSGIGPKATISMKSGFPWAGENRITIEDTQQDAWTLAMRIPSWSVRFTVRINGENCDAEARNGYVHIRRQWKPNDVVELNLAMVPTWIMPHPRIDAIRGCVALQRGPLIYCFEQCDLPPACRLDDVAVDASHLPVDAWQADVMDGLMMIETPARLRKVDWPEGLYRSWKPDQPASEPITLKAIPYYAWANRQSGAMRVWMPLA